MADATLTTGVEAWPIYFPKRRVGFIKLLDLFVVYGLVEREAGFMERAGELGYRFRVPLKMNKRVVRRLER